MKITISIIVPLLLLIVCIVSCQNWGGLFAGSFTQQECANLMTCNGMCQPGFGNQQQMNRGVNNQNFNNQNFNNQQQQQQCISGLCNQGAVCVNASVACQRVCGVSRCSLVVNPGGGQFAGAGMSQIQCQ